MGKAVKKVAAAVGIGGDKPKVKAAPAPAPAAPSGPSAADIQAKQNAQNEEERRRQGGLASTILTGPGGLIDDTRMARRTLL